MRLIIDESMFFIDERTKYIDQNKKAHILQREQTNRKSLLFTSPPKRHYTLAVFNS